MRAITDIQPAMRENEELIRQVRSVPSPETVLEAGFGPFANGSLITIFDETSGCQHAAETVNFNRIR